MPSVRKATSDDVEPIGDALARAFYDDPLTGWTFPGEERRERRSRRWFAIRCRRLLAQEEVYTGGDGSGAALWALPDRWKVEPGELFQWAYAVMPALSWRMPRVVRGLAGIEARHPHTPPHYYLAVLGVDPSAQGRGLGSALIAPVLESCDVDRIPAYLETAKERNLAFYARHGFRVTDELRMPKGGPPVWLMWRDPRG